MRRQKRKKKCLIFACMRPLQTDMRRHRCRRGWEWGPGRCSPRPTPPAAASLRAAAVSRGRGGHRARTPPSEDQTPPAKHLILPGKDIPLCPQKELWGHEAPTTNPTALAPTTLRGGTRIPALGTLIAGGWQRGLALTKYLRGCSSLCRRWARIRPERGAGLSSFTADFPAQVQTTQETRFRQKITLSPGRDANAQH